MADENILPRDQNHVTASGFESSSTPGLVLPGQIDEITGRILVDNSGGGSGTVTSVSVVTANGFAGSVANATTTPAITLSTTVTGLVKGNGTAISAAVAGTDYTDAAFKTISVSGQSDVVADSPADTLTLAAGANITITTNASTDTITIAASGSTGVATVTGTADRITIGGTATDPTVDIAATYVGQNTITTLGTVSTGTWSATTVAVNKGGTGQTSYTDGQLLIGNSTGNTLAKATLTAGTGVSITNGSGSITISAAAGGLTVGTSPIASGTTTRILYDNSGVLGEYTITGTGTVVAMQTNPTLSGLTMTDATNIVLDTTTGTKIGTGTTQKLAFYNSTPIVKPTGDVATALSNLGLVGSPTVAANTITSRTLWGQAYDGSANVSGSLTAVGDITGGASNMIITAGTGNSRTLTLRTTTSGGVATAAITMDATQGSTFGGDLTVSTKNIITDTTTGTKIGTGTTQKIGFYNATPVVQQTGDVATALSTLGLVATPMVTATNISTATESSDTTCFPVFVTASGTQTLPAKTNTTLVYNSSTSSLGATLLTATTSVTSASILASSNDSGALGASGTAFSDLFLASGGVINWAAGDYTLTHATGILTANKDFRITSANVGTNADSVPTLSSTSTLTNKTLTSPTIQTSPVLAAATNLKYTVASSDGTATGDITNEFNSGYSSTAVGDLVYLDSSATWQKAKADSTTTSTNLLGIALSVAASGNAVTVLLRGFIYAATPFPTFTIGAPIYVSGTTAGVVTQTAPTTTDYVTRVVGYAVHADKMWFCPSNDWLTHT